MPTPDKDGLLPVQCPRDGNALGHVNPHGAGDAEFFLLAGYRQVHDDSGMPSYAPTKRTISHHQTRHGRKLPAPGRRPTDATQPALVADKYDRLLRNLDRLKSEFSGTLDQWMQEIKEEARGRLTAAALEEAPRIRAEIRARGESIDDDRLFDMVLEAAQNRIAAARISGGSAVGQSGPAWSQFKELLDITLAGYEALEFIDEPTGGSWRQGRRRVLGPYVPSGGQTHLRLRVQCLRGRLHWVTVLYPGDRS